MAPNPASEVSSVPGEPPSLVGSWARAAWENVRSGATHFHQRQVPPPTHPVRGFFHGLCLPFHLARALFADAAAGRRYLRVSILQCLVILALGLTFKPGGIDASLGDLLEPPPLPPVPALPAERPKTSAVMVIEDEDGPPVQVRFTPEGIRLEKPSEPGVPAEEALRAEVARAEAIAQAARAQAEASRERVKFRLNRENLSDATTLEFWAAVFAAMQIAQWVVIALSRDYHDAISRDVSLLTGIEPEDEPLTPRVRLNMPWVRKKLSRRWRALVVFLAGMPVILLFAVPLPYTDSLLAVLVPAWSAYWVVVFTAGKSRKAWEDTAAREPWFVRGWRWLTTRVPGFRWEILRLYGPFWADRTRPIFSPVAELEWQPWAYSGLAVMRALAMVPLLKCFLRPLIPVAAAHLLAAHRAALAPALPASQPVAPSESSPSSTSAA